MKPTTRTFIALPLPEEAKHRLVRLQEELAPGLPAFRWAGLEQLHMTLAFLGDVPDARLAALGDRVAEAVADFEPLTLRVGGLGAFPTLARPRIIWVGLDGPDLASLRRLRESVVRAAKASGAHPADDRFTPHITIGRLRPGRGRPPDLRPILDPLGDWSAGSHQVDNVVVYASFLSPQGPTYTVLANAPMKAGKTRPRLDFPGEEEDTVTIL